LGALNFDDIHLSPLKRISTVGGDVMHGMKSLDAGFKGFGEAYFTWINTGAVKAWKKHTRMTMNIVVPVGMVRFVFYADERKEFRVEDVGESRYMRLTVPPGIWFGFQGLSAPQNLLLNLANIEHDPDEVSRRDKNSIDYNWK
jgi:dTDP-4-dehydrorhamnose 3,5-epimerase